MALEACSSSSRSRLRAAFWFASSPAVEADTINTRLARDSDEKLPFKVEYSEGVGNFVVASRDIRPNEVRVYGFMACIFMVTSVL